MFHVQVIKKIARVLLVLAVFVPGDLVANDEFVNEVIRGPAGALPSQPQISSTDPKRQLAPVIIHDDLIINQVIRRMTPRRAPSEVILSLARADILIEIVERYASEHHGRSLIVSVGQVVPAKCLSSELLNDIRYL